MRRKAKAIYFIYKRNGLYDFILKNIYKLGLSIVFIISLLLVIKSFFTIRVTDILSYLPIQSELMYFSFFVSESFLGILPPDFFILWATKFYNFWSALSLLAILSYLGGINSYLIGKKLGEYSFIHKIIKPVFEKNKKIIEKFAGFIIVISALTPLPFSPISMIAGSINFSFNYYLFFALTRFIRFAIYGWAILHFAV